MKNLIKKIANDYDADCESDMVQYIVEDDRLIDYILETLRETDLNLKHE